MRSKWFIRTPNNIEATLQITMSVQDWKALYEQLDNMETQSHWIGMAIYEMLKKIELFESVENEMELKDGETDAQ